MVVTPWGVCPSPQKLIRQKRCKPSSERPRWPRRSGQPPRVRGQRCEGAGAQRRSKEERENPCYAHHSIENPPISHLLAQGEDGQSGGGDEGEEGQLEGVPGLQSQDSQSQGDQSHGLQEHEHHDGDEDLLQLGLAGLHSAAGGSEVDLEVHLVGLGGGGVGDGGIGGRDLELNVAALHEALQLGGQIVGSGRHLVVSSSVAGHLDVVEDLLREEMKILIRKALLDTLCYRTHLEGVPLEEVVDEAQELVLGAADEVVALAAGSGGLSHGEGSRLGGDEAHGGHQQEAHDLQFEGHFALNSLLLDSTTEGPVDLL